VTQPNDHAATLLERAQALVPVLAERAIETETLRRLPDETIAEIKAAGLHHMGKPARLGGAELALDHTVDILATLARGCTSTAWVCGVYTDHSIITGMFPPQAADDVWADNPDAVISAGYFPAGTNERVDGGWLLAGTWRFVSGCDHADWFLLGSMIADDEGGEATAHACLMPRSEIEIEDNWHVMGLCGTGSKNVIVKDGFVPNYRILPLAKINGGWDSRGRPDVPPLYRLPHVSTVPFFFKATALGIAESMLDDFVEQMSSRASFGNPVAEYATLQMHIAEAAAEIDCARLLIKRDTAEAMAAMRDGAALSLRTRARNRRDQAYSARLCRQAIDRLFGASGAHNVFSDNVSQRKFRDMRVASNHIAANWDVAGTTFGRVAFGLDPATRLI
jgi:resorcinol 4-hydroxylase (FADH2)